jgi:SRSO17 transposase
MYFRTRSHDNTPMALNYLCGLFQCDRSNMERMEEVLPKAHYENLQHFVSESEWDRFGLMGQVAMDADKLLGGFAGSTLIIDPTAFAKRGRKSVGVARQWNGRLGKQENSQVGVFAMLCHDRFVTPLDFRLFLPQEWTDNPVRCRAAHVPEEAIHYRTKAQLALEMVRVQRELQVGYNWVLADSEFSSFEFCGGLAEAGDVFIVGLEARRTVLLGEDDQVPNCNHFQEHSKRVDEYERSLAEGDWEQVKVRDGEKGEIWVSAHTRLVWVWDYYYKCPRRWHLLIVRNADGEIKFALSNAPANTTLGELTRIHAQRFWVERSFEDAKSEVGMAEYQVRGWLGWHNHMALCCLALLFLLRVRLFHTETPMLSARDIRRLLEHFLPQRVVNARDILNEISRRHRRRQHAAQSAKRRRRRHGHRKNAEYQITK